MAKIDKAAVCLALTEILLSGSPAAALTPTPSATPCTTVPPPQLSVTLDVKPAHPIVGDQVVLTFHASISGGIPQFMLIGGNPNLQGTPGPVYKNPVQFELTAAQAGTAMVSLSVNFER
jgi:hypothetical protein